MSGQTFADDKGPVSPLSTSLLYAADGRDYRPLLDQLHKEGVEACRWFASKLTPSDTRPGVSLEDAEAKSIVIAKDLLDRKMLGHAVGFCDTKSWQDWARWEAHARWLGQFLVANPHLVGEVINEWLHNTQYPFTIAECERLVNIIRGEGFNGVLAAGAWNIDELKNGKYDPAEVRGTNCITSHFERTNEPAWDMVNHGFAEKRVIQDEYPDAGAGMSGEPKRCDDGPVQPPGVFPYLLGVEAQGFNDWTTLHSSSLRECQVLSGQNLTDLRLFLRGGRILPRGQYHYENAGWGGSPVWNAAFCEWGPNKPPTAETKAVWRVHCFKHEPTGQWFMVTYGPDALNPVIEFQNGFEIDKEIDRLDQYVTVHTLKQG